MTDASKLRVGLEAYRVALAQHHSALAEQHARLSTAWARLREHYQGRGADAFAEVWQRCDARFRQYIDESGELRGVIDAQLAELERFDRPDEPVV